MEDLLIGWKEISSYLRISVQTAWRYQKSKGLPVKKDPAGHPIIKKSTADKWRLKQQSQSV